MIDTKAIADRICILRKQRGLSQEELADKTNLSRVFISQLERDEKSASLHSVIEIANALCVSADDILSENLLVSTSRIASQELDILHDCTKEEMDILLQNMKQLKELLRNYKKR